MSKITAAITGVNGWTPEYKLTNQELSTMVDTNDAVSYTHLPLPTKA